MGAGFLGGGLKYIFFIPNFGEMIQFDEYCSKGLKPPTSFVSDNFAPKIV